MRTRTWAQWFGVAGALAACTPTQPSEPGVAFEEAVVEPEPALEPALELEPAAELGPAPVAEAAEAPEPLPTPSETADGVDDAKVPTIRAGTRFPENVHMAFADRETGWTVDILDPFGRNTRRIYDNLGLSEESAVEDVTLESGGPGVPRGWKLGDTWTLVTRKGVIRRSAGRFVLNEGAGELHLEVQLRRARSPSRNTVLAIRGRDVPNDLRLVAPTPRNGSDLDLDVLRSTVVAEVEDAYDRRLFERARIEADNVRIYAARMPAPYTDIVVLDAPARSAADGRASALLLRHRDGDLTHVRIAAVQGRIELRAVLDIDGNGTDEAVYEDSYHEGSYDKLLYFRDGKPKVRVLAGDGA